MQAEGVVHGRLARAFNESKRWGEGGSQKGSKEAGGRATWEGDLVSKGHTSCCADARRTAPPCRALAGAERGGTAGPRAHAAMGCRCAARLSR